MDTPITLRKVAQNLTNWGNDNWIKVFVEPVSIPVAWFVLKFTGLTANQITILGLAAGVSGNLASVWLGPSAGLIGFLVFFYMDFVDGKVARGRGGGTPFGKRLDILVDRAVFSLTLLVSSWHLSANGYDYPVFMLLLLYALTYYYVDIIEFSGVILRHSSSANASLTAQATPQWSHFSSWLPSRLSSPLLVILGALLFDSPIIGLLLGITSIVIRLLLNIFIRQSRALKKP